MLTEELHDALEGATATPPFTVDVGRVMRLSRRRRTRQRAMAAVSVAAVIAIVAAVTVSSVNNGNEMAPAAQPPTIGLGGPQLPVTPAELVAAYSHWGPTRGDLASNSAAVSAALAAWSKPVGEDGPMWVPGGPRALGGSPRVLYVGNTPDGVAAVVDQPSTDQHVKLYIGILIGHDVADLHLVGDEYDNDLSYDTSPHNTGSYDGNPISADLAEGETETANPDVMSFATSRSDQHAVVLPVDPNDTVSVPDVYRIGSRSVSRTWAATPTPGGVGAINFNRNLLGTLLRVAHNGSIVDISPVAHQQIIGALPSNAIKSTSIGLVTRDQTGSSTLGTAPYQWVRSRYGTASDPDPAQPYGGRPLLYAGFSPSWSVEVDEEWIAGGPAHAVVLLERLDGKQVGTSVLADPLIRRGRVPVVSARLGHGLGWIVYAGPGAEITGYRPVGATSWQTTRPGTMPKLGRAGNIATREAAAIPTNTYQLQVRLSINGHSRVVNERRPPAKLHLFK